VRFPKNRCGISACNLRSHRGPQRSWHHWQLTGTDLCSK
jgi:hypothetical protein